MPWAPIPKGESNGRKTFGKAMKRVEDPRFITGTGNYTDDMTLPGMVRGHGSFAVRPRPHQED